MQDWEHSNKNLKKHYFLLKWHLKKKPTIWFETHQSMSGWTYVTTQLFPFEDLHCPKTSTKREFSGSGWATTHERPDPFNCFKWLAVSSLCIFFFPFSCCYDCCSCFARTCYFPYHSLFPLLNWPAVKIQIALLYFIMSHLMGQKCLISAAWRIWIRPADSSSTHFLYLDPWIKPGDGNQAHSPGNIQLVTASPLAKTAKRCGLCPAQDESTAQISPVH